MMIISFYKFKLCKCKRQLYVIYIIKTIKKIVYKIKKWGRDDVNTRFL